jgi:Zn-dependent protease
MVVSIPVHEAMHGFAAHYLGDSTAEDAGRLTLNPIKHVDILMTVILPAILLLCRIPPIFIAKPVPFNPANVRYGNFGAALVGLAGPFTNLILASIVALFVHIFAGDLTSTIGTVLLYFIEINVVLFVFNMIPLPPLDGSRLLYALAPDSVQRIMYQMESAGLGVTIIVLLLLSSFISPVVSNIANAIVTFLLR